jgi:hypothetical protein
MELSLVWKPNSGSVTQEITNILWNHKVHYRVHRSPRPPLIPVMSQINLIHSHPNSLLSILIYPPI